MAKKVTSANEAFTRLHEDPMLIIKQQQLAARKRVVENPIKMQRIREEVRKPLPNNYYMFIIVCFFCACVIS